jgi:hypothetical protein
MSLKKAKARGRPPLPTAEKRVKNFTFRSRGGLHERLVKAAADSDRSISEEIEHRLERSFNEGDDSLSKALVGNNNTGANIIRWIAFQMQCDPKWDSTRAGGEEMAQRICDHVRSQLVFPDLSQATGGGQ